jgi:hypothetical protein
MEMKIHLRISENTLCLKQGTDNIECLDFELYQTNQIHSIKKSIGRKIWRNQSEIAKRKTN